MAEQKFRVELSGIERQWLGVAVDRLMQSLERSRKKEPQGSEVDAIRKREIEALESLKRRL